MRSFGDLGYGVSDDTAALQPALSHVRDSGGGTAYLPGYTGHGNILLEGGTRDGNAVEVPRYNDILSFGHVTGVTVWGTVIRNVPGSYAAALGRTQGAVGVPGPHIEDCSREGHTPTSGAR